MYGYFVHLLWYEEMQGQHYGMDCMQPVDTHVHQSMVVTGVALPHDVMMIVVGHDLISMEGQSQLVSRARLMLQRVQRLVSWFAVCSAPRMAAQSVTGCFDSVTPDKVDLSAV